MNPEIVTAIRNASIGFIIGFVFTFIGRKIWRRWMKK